MYDSKRAGAHAWTGLVMIVLGNCMKGNRIWKLEKAYLSINHLTVKGQIFAGQKWYRQWYLRENVKDFLVNIHIILGAW